jgi:cell fate regulator YaaT (PSP1 superfamily)
MSDIDVDSIDTSLEEDMPTTAAPRRCDSKCPCPRGKLRSYNYLQDVPGAMEECNIVEVLFKNTRKGYYVNSLKIPLEKGDMVAVESSPGHDVGMVTLTGPLVWLQMKRAGVRRDSELRRVFRIAKPADLEKYEESRAREEATMIRARQIANELGLNMKIGDVEFQGDGNKAIFYYIADERVDFRQLIKVLADAFKVRIEMKQIGARQEAGRIGGIGPCGRPLCCSTWINNFVSVATAAARFQDLSLNPQKLAGQCAKLKCCLNYEVDSYVEASRKLPAKDVRLETADSTWYFFKADIFRGEIAYSTDRKIPANLTTISAARAFEIIALNKAGEKPLNLRPDSEVEAEAAENRSTDLLNQDNINRFDRKKNKKKKKKPAADKADKPEGKAESKPEGKPEGKKEKPEKPAKADKPERKPAQQQEKKDKAKKE